MPTHHPADKTLMNFTSNVDMIITFNNPMSNILAKNFGNSKKAAKFDKIGKAKISRL